MPQRFKKDRRTTRKNRFHLFLMTAAVWCVRFFSKVTPYRLGVEAGAVIGFVFYYLLARDRKRARQHLAMVFKDKDRRWIRRMARSNFIHLGRSMMEAVLITPRRLLQVTEFTAREKIAQALERVRGMIWVTGHIGNWELMAASAAVHFPLSVVAAPVDPPQVNDFILRLRARMGIQTIVRDRPGAAKELIRVFRENRVLGILIDQDTKKVEGAFVDFMGLPAWTPTAAAQMALRFDAPVFLGYIVRRGAMEHRIFFEGPLELVRTGDLQRDIVANTAMMTKKLEAAILEHPEQWVWMHRRWKRKP